MQWLCCPICAESFITFTLSCGKVSRFTPGEQKESLSEFACAAADTGFLI
jgi:hypothetical protein